MFQGPLAPLPGDVARHRTPVSRAWVSTLDFWGMSQATRRSSRGVEMVLIIALILLALLFGGLGFAVHALWIVAVVLLVAWLIALMVGRGARV